MQPESEQYEYHYQDVSRLPDDVYISRKSSRLDRLRSSGQIHVREYKGVLIASTANVEHELDFFADLIDKLTPGVASYFSAMISDSRALHRYLFIIAGQEPSGREEFDGLMYTCQDFIMQEFGGWNGIEVQNGVNARIATYKASWSDDPFALNLQSTFDLDEHGPAHRDLVTHRFLSGVLPAPVDRGGGRNG